MNIRSVFRVARWGMSKSTDEIKSTGVASDISKERVDTGKSPDTLTPGTSGCTTSFVGQKNNEMDKVCGAVQPDPKKEYVQNDEEKESGGEA